MNELLKKTILACTAFTTATFGIGLLASRESDCLNHVHIKNNVATCNSEEGVQIQGSHSEPILVPSTVLCDADKAYIYSDQHVRTYKNVQYAERVGVVDVNTGEISSQDFIFPYSRPERC